ncbi:MAG: SpoIIE family protein phosphatase, partial [Lachnospiraceae bacterium]|nr:SpoIIE family protein phosphatase [Lachnospiraceae bacterium]
VAGAGLFLDTIRQDVDGFQLGENGYACIINSRGQVLFSGASEGDLAASEDMESDIRRSTNTELANLASDALAGQAGVNLIELNGQKYYIGYAPMETVGWTYMTVLPETEVTAPTTALVEKLDAHNADQNEYVHRSVIKSVQFIVLFLVILGAIMLFVAARFADKLADPIAILTGQVSQIEGDNLDFTCDLHTGDEVQVLGEAFESMTGRMKTYIDDITAITAEKERIGAELSVATHIQASMLPCIFPPYPDRDEFELFASMDPAREVGGDFYDFFLVDSDHLGIVIADVSGKGVPAALFMVISKTLIKNRALSGESVDEVFTHANNQLCEGNAEDMFVTAWIGIIELSTGHMQWCDAGHEIPYLIHGDGSIEKIMPERKKLPLAAIEDTGYVSNELDLNRGDMIFLYTDGVPEACDMNNELYGIRRLELALSSEYRADPETLLKAIRSDVDGFVGEAPQFDDLTMLCIQYRGTGRDMSGDPEV